MRSGCLVMYGRDVRECLLSHASLGGHEEAHELKLMDGIAYVRTNNRTRYGTARRERENWTENESTGIELLN